MSGSGSKDGKGARPVGPRCPICKEPTSQKYRPFCSNRCADLDLGRWMKGAYAVPAEEEGDPDAEDHAAAQRDADRGER